MSGNTGPTVTVCGLTVTPSLRRHVHHVVPATAKVGKTVALLTARGANKVTVGWCQVTDVGPSVESDRDVDGELEIRRGSWPNVPGNHWHSVKGWVQG